MQTSVIFFIVGSRSDVRIIKIMRMINIMLIMLHQISISRLYSRSYNIKNNDNNNNSSESQ
jgi:hypothetical protein